MEYKDLKNLIHVDLIDYKEIEGMKLILRFRIHRDSNEQSYTDLINFVGDTSLDQDDAKFPLIEIAFDSYIGFSIRKESYTLWDDYEEFEGKIFRVFEKSRYLDFIRLATFASEEHPGPFKHYGVAGLNHIVDIISSDDPIVRV
ncbi:hypothetical protein I8J29_22540 [Paenibacillus sp. MWE-103]|uniref:Uncharacterized protein n=1 Tax=Paenibacillus artemisiicola TaxID=1172618 RepID=A0ABS3WF86_9BACL|nr:hypothetical protein [Paenibacillus artemisiicola]MBO7746986.1 hypothetical protein [Paenibacillus artemisiicola]